MYEPRNARDLDDAPAQAGQTSPGKSAASQRTRARHGATGNPSGASPGGDPSWQADYDGLWALLAGQPEGEETRDTQARDEFRSGERWGGLKRQQPSAPPIVEEFRPLPAWAGMTIGEFNDANLASEIPMLTVSAGLDGFALMPLVRGWPERLAAGRTTCTASTDTHRVEMTLGYDRATARGGNSYHADLAWRVEISALDGSGTRDVKVHHGGRIVFTTQRPVPELVHNSPESRSPDALALDPTGVADRRDGPINCSDVATVSRYCYATPSERAAQISSTERSITHAGQNFIRACEALAERLRKAAEADAAFAGAIVDCALGFGISRLASAASKAVNGALGAGAKVVEKSVEKLLGEPKDLLKSALTADRMSTAQTLVAAIREGADGAFLQISAAVSSRTDAEIWLLSATFPAATQAHYEAQLTEFLAQYARQVAPIGEHQRPGGGDYAEFVVWMFDPATRRKRLGYVRAEERAGSDHGRPTTAAHRQLLGWVDDPMVPYALDRHQRLYGPVADWTLGLVGDG